MRGHKANRTLLLLLLAATALSWQNMCDASEVDATVPQGETMAAAGVDEAHDEDEEEDEEDVYDPENEPAVNACRRNPTWKGVQGVDYEECKKLTGWQPRDYYWKNDTFGWDDNLGKEKMQLLDQCLNDALKAAVKDTDNVWASCNETDKTDACYIEDVSVSGRYTHVEDGDLVMIHDALTEQEVYALQSLVECIHQNLPLESPFYIERPFGDDEEADTYGLYNVAGGNLCTFLAALLQHYIPGVAASIYNAVKTAYDYADWDVWDYPAPASLGLRTAEYLQYKKTGRLGLHQDTGSVLTISVAMSETTEYKGGYFQLSSSQAMFKVPRRSAVVFFSESTHGITQIVDGEREVFVVELWPWEDLPLGPPRMGPDHFENYKEERAEALEAAASAQVEGDEL